MSPLLRFLPFLALIALMSIEVSVEAQGKIAGNAYSQLIEAGAVNGLDLSIRALNNPGTPDEMATTLCTKAEVAAGSCSPDPTITWDKQGAVEVTFKAPPASDSSSFLNGDTPKQYRTFICYSEPDLVKRKWRAFKDSIGGQKGDKSCFQKTDFEPYPATGGPVTEVIPIKSITPTGIYTVQIMVQCEGQEGDSYCYVANPKEARLPGKLYYAAYVMDSRPTGMFVAVIVCVIIGPLLLAGFLIYERGVLAKKAT